MRAGPTFLAKKAASQYYHIVENSTGTVCTIRVDSLRYGHTSNFVPEPPETWTLSSLFAGQSYLDAMMMMYVISGRGTSESLQWSTQLCHSRFIRTTSTSLSQFDSTSLRTATKHNSHDFEWQPLKIRQKTSIWKRTLSAMDYSRARRVLCWEFIQVMEPRSHCVQAAGYTI